MQKRHRRMVRCRRVQLPVTFAATRARPASRPTAQTPNAMTPWIGPGIPASLPFTAASARIFRTATKTALAPRLAHATCVPARTVTRAPVDPHGSATRGQAFSGSATVIDVALLPCRAPRMCRAWRGATAAAAVAATANSICIKQVSCAFRNACLTGLALTSGPQNARIVTPIMQAAILLNRQGFPALQPFSRKHSKHGCTVGCAVFSCISCTKNRQT